MNALYLATRIAQAMLAAAVTAGMLLVFEFTPYVL